MKKVILLFFLLIAFYLSGQDVYIIKKIELEGNKTISNSKLKRVMTLKSENLLHKLLFWKESPTFNETYLLDDIEEITRFYQEEGFLQVEVNVDQRIDHSGRKVSLKFLIKENTHVLIDDIKYKITGNSGEKQDRITELINEEKKKWKAQTNRRFRDQDVRSTLKQIIKYLIQEGYPDPENDFEIKLKDQNSKASITFNIDPGEYCRFGNVYVTGNNKIRSNLILNQLSFTDQDEFNQNEIEKSQRQIQQLGVFQYVALKSRINEISNNRIPIEINVSELPFWSLKTGVGYGLEDRFRVSLSLKKLGFLGGTRRAIFTAKHSFLEPYNFELKMIQPAFIRPGDSFILNPFILKENESAYDLVSYGFSTTIQQDISVYTSVFISYKFEHNFLTLENKDAEDNPDLNEEYYNKSSVSLGISRDNSLPPFFPEKGWHTSLVTTLSGLKLRSKYHYLQGLIDIRRYQHLVGKLVLAGKIKIGSIKPIWGDEETPIEDRFYAGGSTSIRGWKRGEIGPLNDDDLPIGGNSYLEMSLELRQLIWKIVYGVAFLDCGNVWNDYNDYHLQNLVYAAGLGLRIKTPIGPVRFDVAQPLESNANNVQLHLSIGQAF
ncbi:MAG: outer membrane protein assembly factor BamA [Candidatus Cloacimonetes bacterium]|nr:outer membrane protein assembly factor BamA [Candidatus Cloacimonadota bacterium]